MHRIDNSTAVTTMPIRKPQGTEGFFSQGSQTAGQLATIVEADILNAMMMEIANVVTRAGITLNKLDDTQLWNAINGLIAAARLGFIPVEQGGGTGQGSNKVHIGWATDGSGLTAQIDAYVAGPIAFLHQPQNWTATQNFQAISATSVSVSTNIDVSGNAYAAATFPCYHAGATQYAFYTNGSLYCHQYQNSYLWEWNNTNGVLAWVANGTTAFTIDTAGNGVFTRDLAAAGQIDASGNLFAASTYPCYHAGATQWQFYVSGNLFVHQYQAGYSWQWNNTNGVLAWYTPSGLMFSIDPAGNGVFTGNLQAYEAVSFVGGGSQAAIFAVADAGAFRMVGVHPNFHQLGVRAYGNILSYNTPNQPDGGGAWTCDINGQTVQGGACFAASYPGPSDASLKTNVAAWTKGLAEVLQINPVSYEFTPDAKLGETGRTYYGVTAQELQPVLPEAVVTMQRHLTDDAAAGNEPPTEVLAVESATIFYACINAIKEIAGRLDAIEARLPAGA